MTVPDITRNLERAHTLYRFFGHDGRLLYVGITADPGVRWKAHAKDKPWWAEVANVTVEPYDSREAVLAAETAAIASEGPLYNVMHNKSEDAAMLRAARRSQPLPPLGVEANDLLADARKHAERSRDELAARDAAMLRARDAGATLVQIGEAVGMSHPGVKKALARVRGESGPAS